MAIPQHIAHILQKRFDGQPLTVQEKLSVEKWYHAENIDNNILLGKENWEKDLLAYIELDADQEKKDSAFQSFMSAINEGAKGISVSTASRTAHRVHFLRKWGWAAAIIVLLGAAAYLYTSTKKTEQSFANDNKPAQTDILPGSNKAILTLSDGTTITLDSAANGAIAQQGNAEITKLVNGEIRYDVKGVSQSEVMMNTMSTPRGGQYQLVLPDGSKIWLNAASSVTYPAAFVGAARKIKVTGEAYLEVVKNKAQPFVVDVDGKSLVEVLGTSFNINSYTDEGEINTTLIEGGVKVVNKSNAGRSVMLLPGQQASLNVAPNADMESISVRPANIEQVLAWKNGIFNINDADLQSVLRQLARWYDITIQYQGTPPVKYFQGKLDRGLSLNQVIEALSQIQPMIDFRLQARTLIVKQKDK